MKKINKGKYKNYLILLPIIIITIILVFYLRAWYRAYNTHQLTIPIISGYLNEVKYDELDNYILENPNFVLYMCTSNDISCREFESKFKKIIKRYSLKDIIIYLNLNDFINQENNYQLLIDGDLVLPTYQEKEEFFNIYPTIAIFKDKQLESILIINDSVTIDKVDQFLEEHEIIIKH